jgi:recombination protein RecA
MFGSPETTTGGNALKFYSSVRLDVRRIGSIKESTSDVIGNRVRVKVVKNKVAPPFREAEFDVIFNEGISKVGEIVDIGVDKGVVDKSGAWYSYKGERMGQGREGAKLFLKEHPELIPEISQLIMSTVGAGSSATAKPATAAAGMGAGLDNEDLEESAEEVKQPFSKGGKGQKRKPDASLNGAEIIV